MSALLLHCPSDVGPGNYSERRQMWELRIHLALWGGVGDCQYKEERKIHKNFRKT